MKQYLLVRELDFIFALIHFDSGVANHFCLSTLWRNAVNRRDILGTGVVLFNVARAAKIWGVAVNIYVDSPYRGDLSINRMNCVNEIRLIRCVRELHVVGKIDPVVGDFSDSSIKRLHKENINYTASCEYSVTRWLQRPFSDGQNTARLLCDAHMMLRFFSFKTIWRARKTTKFSYTTSKTCSSTFTSVVLESTSLTSVFQSLLATNAISL